MWGQDWKAAQYPFLNFDNKRTFANVMDIFGVVLGAARIRLGAVLRKEDIRPECSVVQNDLHQRSSTN